MRLNQDAQQVQNTFQWMQPAEKRLKQLETHLYSFNSTESLCNSPVSSESDLEPATILKDGTHLQLQLGLQEVQQELQKVKSYIKAHAKVTSNMQLERQVMLAHMHW